VETAIPIAELVPHSGRMSLLDTLIAHDATSLTAELTVRSDSPFVEHGQVGSWLGLEYMAQAIAAFAGSKGRANGEPPKLGFLIGSRHYHANTPCFRVGDTMRVTITVEIEDESGLGSFQGRIIGDGIEVTATVAVYQPPDIARFLEESQS
jgi:predicted hotdog family 3-hydroxylacyl-ACP dehydratase